MPDADGLTLGGALLAPAASEVEHFVCAIGEREPGGEVIDLVRRTAGVADGLVDEQDPLLGEP